MNVVLKLIFKTQLINMVLKNKKTSFVNILKRRLYVSFFFLKMNYFNMKLVKVSFLSFT